MELRLDNPLWLWLLVPVIAYFGLLGYRNFKRYAKLYRFIYAVRFLTAALLVFALAEPAAYRPAQEEQIIFLMDRSASMEGLEGEMADAIETAISNKKDSQNIGVYTFAEDFQTLLPVSKSRDRCRESRRREMGAIRTSPVPLSWLPIAATRIWRRGLSF
nr:VWA domain-containing protein [Planococcus glaciei]